MTDYSQSNPQTALTAPPRKKRLLWLTILIGFVLAIGIVVGLAFWLTSGLIDPIDRQLAALKRSDFQAAYAENSLALRDKFLLNDFENFVKKFPILMNNNGHSFLNRSFKDRTGTVEGTLTDDRGAVTPVQYQFVKENDAWRISYIHIGAKPPTSNNPGFPR